MAARGALSSALTQGGGSDGGRAGHYDVAHADPLFAIIWLQGK